MIEPAANTSELDAFLGTAPRAAWRRSLLWLTIAAGIMALALLVVRFANGGQAGNYVSKAVETGDITVSIRASGTLEPTGTSVAGTALAGLVRDVLVAKGDTVAKGQLLARLDPQLFRDALARNRQALAEKRAILATAQDAERETDARLQLFLPVQRRSGGLAPSDRELRQARTSLSDAGAAVQRAELAVESTRTDVADRATTLAATDIRSPIDGVVAQISTHAGQRLGPDAAGALMFVITAPYSRLDLRAAVDAETAARLPSGAPVRVTVAGLPRDVFPGRLIDDATSRASRGQLLIEVASAGRALRPGMIATASIAIGVHRNVMVVPDAALQFARAGDARRGTAGGNAVYVLDSDGAPRRQPVTAIASDGGRTEVAPGALAPGTRVILGLR